MLRFSGKSFFCARIWNREAQYLSNGDLGLTEVASHEPGVIGPFFSWYHIVFREIDLVVKIECIGGSREITKVGKSTFSSIVFGQTLIARTTQ